MKKFTILMAAIALVCFSVPAMAVDWNFYGSARMQTFWVSDDFNDDTSQYTATGDDKDQDLQWDLNGGSRFGANVKADHIKAQVEMGMNDSASNVTLRRVYADWNFGAGTLKVGKDYTPVDQFISGQIFDDDLGLLGVGTQYGGRHGQIALGFGGFQIALITPSSGYISGLAATDGSPAVDELDGTVTAAVNATPDNGDVDEIIPKIAASWGMGFDAFNFNIMGGYNYFTIGNVVSSVDGSKNDIKVTSYTVGGDAGFNFGPAYVKAAVSYGQNIGTADWGIPGNRNQGGFAVWDGDDSTDDVNTLQAALVAGLKVSDMLSFEGGFGYRVDDPDEGDKSKPWAAYVQAVIALAPGVYVIPEVGYFDGDQTYAGDDTTDTLYLGAKWQIDF